ncbi:PREDICTED: microfibril-associated glycoprotein 4-like [Drosophila arizonae]|uniref:Microfibril-associated glycoprotein 4-like n=1 Tax=Drosophila arizonae TaxID=7263 RepID=A0ABM1NP99_DROAR|nr:PREDICTED: microfibril-associated glycoprotein 4-like [Drosophila arizonae]
MENDAQCGPYCYRLVKPLLLSAALADEKERQLRAEIQRLESQLEQSKAHQKHCLTKEDLLSSQPMWIDKLPDANKVQLLSNNGSEIIGASTEDNAVPEKRLSANEAETKVNLITSCIGQANGIYELKMQGSSPFKVPCDSNWTVIQRRLDGSVDFNRNMSDYRSGFGQLDGEFFIGLDKLYLLTKSQPHELYISMKDVRNHTLFKHYLDFRIGGEEDNFRLISLGQYNGNLRDEMSHQVNSAFSTYDNDNDVYPYNCALLAQSGWWFSSCFDR